MANGWVQQSQKSQNYLFGQLEEHLHYSITVSVFADIFIGLTNTVADGKIQITILILRWGSLSNLHHPEQVHKLCSASDGFIAMGQIHNIVHPAWAF